MRQQCRNILATCKRWDIFNPARDTPPLMTTKLSGKNKEVVPKENFYGVNFNKTMGAFSMPTKDNESDCDEDGPLVFDKETGKMVPLGS